MRDLDRKPAWLEKKTLAISVLLALLASGGWAAAIVQWHHLIWLIGGAVATFVAVLAAADLMGRLSMVLVNARVAVERALERKDRVQMPEPPSWKVRDEADELPGLINRVLADLPQSRPLVARKESADPLTSLPNHRQFHERLAEEIKRADRYDHAVSVLMVDIDDFRHINEEHGHGIGDEVLRQAAQLTSGAIRSTDVLARYGGDEFAVLLPETNLNGALKVAGKIVSDVGRRSLHVAPTPRGRLPGIIRLTVSIGAASFPQHSVRKDGLIMAADVAMYMAKHSGKDKVCPFNRVPGAHEVTDPYQLYQFLQNSDWGALEALVAAVDARDRITGGHSKSVMLYSVALARAIGLSEYDVNAIRSAALLHDVGKIGIPDRILVKTGSLSEEERALIESHPAVGESLARRSLSLSSALPGILYHHERYDGKGYPVGLSGDEIPVGARIIAIADAYDAMVSHRHYRNPPGRARARRELELGATQQWDPELVRAFLRLEAEGHLDSVEAAEPELAATRK